MSLLHDDRDENDFDAGRPRERELTLSTGTILGIFFGLALLCGAFFGFGYNVGSKARPVAVASAEGTPAQANFDAFKPSSGAPVLQPVPGYPAPAQAGATTRGPSATAYPPGSATDLSPVKPPPVPRVAPSPGTTAETGLTAAPVVRSPATVHLAPTSPDPSAGAPAGGSFMVQVAAVTHQEDADLMVNSLHRRGYAVVSHTEAQDRFFHIQVGPFLNKKDAEAMRQRLIGDGYNAILK